MDLGNQFRGSISDRFLNIFRSRNRSVQEIFSRVSAKFFPIKQFFIYLFVYLFVQSLLFFYFIRSKERVKRERIRMSDLKIA